MSAIFVVDFALSAVAILSANRAVQIMDTVLGVKVLRDTRPLLTAVSLRTCLLTASPLTSLTQPLPLGFGTV
jgi:hypothetical protein